MIEIAKNYRAARSKRRRNQKLPEVNWKQFEQLAEMVTKYGLGQKVEQHVIAIDGLKMIELVFEVLAENCDAKTYEKLSGAILARAEILDGP